MCPCGQKHDGWPGKDGAELCQMCWEAYCSETWWAQFAYTPPTKQETDAGEGRG